jgi:hypothetical protein
VRRALRGELQSEVRPGDAAVHPRQRQPFAPLRHPRQRQRLEQRLQLPLRVARVMEAQHHRSQAGRMVISGRMADVCAELDRLAELENRH